MTTIVEIRETKTGKFQLVRNGELSRASVTGRNVFVTRPEAEQALIAMRARIDDAEVDKIEHDARRAPYIIAYAQLLQSPELREMRQNIQELYGESAHQSKLAGDAQRAAIRGAGQIFCMGRDIGQVRQGTADSMASDADGIWAAWSKASTTYEREVDRRMVELNIPLYVRHGS